MYYTVIHKASNDIPLVSELVIKVNGKVSIDTMVIGQVYIDTINLGNEYIDTTFVVNLYSMIECCI